MKTLFLLHEQYGNYRECPGYTEIYLPMKHSGLIDNSQILIYQRKYFTVEQEYLEDKLNQLYLELKDKPLVIYGAGEHARSLYSSLKKFNIVAIADKNQDLHGKDLYGMEIIAPSEIAKYSQNVLIVSKAFENEIYNELAVLFPDMNILKMYNNTDFYKLANRKIQDLILEKLIEYKPDLIVYTPSWPSHCIEKETFENIKNLYPKIKIMSIWWDYDERITNKQFSYLKFEKESLVYADYIIENTSYTRYQRIKKNEGIYKEYNANKVYWHPTLFNPYIYKKEATIKKYNIAIFGSNEGIRKKWISKLKELFPEDFFHFGSLSDIDERISSEEYVHKINQTKIFVNTQTFKYRIQLKGKIREALACGCFVLEEDNAETRAYVPEGCGIVYFKDIDDLESKIEYYLSHEKEREAIALKGYNWFNTKHNSVMWTSDILNKLKLK